MQNFSFVFVDSHQILNMGCGTFGFSFCFGFSSNHRRLMIPEKVFKCCLLTISVFFALGSSVHSVCVDLPVDVVPASVTHSRCDRPPAPGT